jgi:hypothetical protein
MIIGGTNIIKKLIIFSLLIIFILIPAAYASDIDDSISNDNLAINGSTDYDNNLKFNTIIANDYSVVGSSNDLADDDLASVECGDTSSDMLLGHKDCETNSEKKSLTHDKLLEKSDKNSEWIDDTGFDWDLGEDDSEYDCDEDKEYNDYLKSLLKTNHDKKTILDAATYFDPNLNIYALFLNKNQEPLKNTKVNLIVNGNKFSVKTDEYGFISVVIRFKPSEFKYFHVTLINPVTGEKYTFPEIYFNASDPANYESSLTTGFKLNNNAHYFTLNSNGIKSTIKNSGGIVSKAITYSKGKVIISTKSNKNDSNSSENEWNTEKIVIDRFSRILIYLIGILCIVVPIGYLRYRKKG